MMQSVWALHDKRTEIYQDPKMFRDDVVAQVYIKRDIERSLQNSDMAFILRDFEYVKLAEWDDTTGDYEPLEDYLRPRIACYTEELKEDE